jgi:hypothetical protein
MSFALFTPDQGARILDAGEAQAVNRLETTATSVLIEESRDPAGAI